jgi:excisionase family DNA binding protein
MSIFDEEFIKELADRVVDRIVKAMPKSTESVVLFNADELAAYLKVSRDWVYDAKQNRKIPFVKVGNSIRYRKSDIDSMLDKQTYPALNPLPAGIGKK